MLAFMKFGVHYLIIIHSKNRWAKLATQNVLI